MFFGENADGANPDSGREHKGRSSNLSGGGYDEYKEQAKIIADRVSEGAKVAKDKMMDWFSQFTTQQ